MTNELNKASFRFEKQRQDKVQQQQQIQPQPSQSLPPQRQLSQQQQQIHIQPQPSQSLQPITMPQQQQQQQQQQYQQHNNNSNQNYKNNIVLNQNNPISSPPQTNIQSPTEENKDPMQWTLSFQPGNSLRLETNITSVEQLVEAVQKIRLLDDPNNNSNNNHNSNNTHTLSLTSASSLSIPWIGSDQLRLGSTTEYWRVALERRPRSILEDYKIDELNLSQLTENVSPHILNYACRVYWDCLHPKFSADWTSFWDRSGDPKRNQVCINSGLAMVFLHIMRHHKDSCPRANEIGYYYYERAREALMDYFDSPDCATLETMMNLAMFCIFYKRHSQARIHIGLSYRMILDMGIHQQSNWPKEDLHLRKKYLKLFMVLYYNDMCVSMYSGEPTQLNDHDIDVDFYELLNVNQTIQPPPDDKAIVKDTFFVHLLSLAKIGKRTLLLMEDYQRQHPDHHQQQHLDDLPLTWANQIQTLEVDLAKWFDKLPNDYRVDPQPTSLPSLSSSASSSSSSSTTSPSTREREHITMNAVTLKKQSALLLMLQYQTQWLLLHKTFANIDPSALSATMAAAYTSSSSSSILPQGADRSREICTDAANRIVVIGEIITEEYGWCVCQQFMSCIYQASTIYCRNALSKNESSKQHAKTMIKRIMEILRSSKINYSGLPDDMIMCLNEFLVKHGMEPPPPSSPSSESSSSKDTCCNHDSINNKNKDEKVQQERPSSSSLEGCQLLDQWVSFEKPATAITTTTIDSLPSETTSSVSPRLDSFNDSLYNSPHKYLECLHQQSIHRPPLSTQYHQTDAMLSIKIQDPIVENTMSMDYELEHRKNWRTMFSSSNITQVHQRML
ncbi:unnamed protein product [Cunninghamella echinulata]